MEEIAQYQKILKTLLKLLDISTEQLGDSIGMTRQSVSNLINGKYKMSRIQFIAIETVLKENVGFKKYYKIKNLVIESKED